MTPGEILDEAIDRHNPSHIFSLLSGGHDSLTVTHFASSVLGDRLSGVVHINTGIGIKETRQFVYDVCEKYRWNLMEYKAAENVNAKGEPDPQIYRELVKQYGFPGAKHHGKMYSRLKERQVRRLIRDHHVKGERILLISGIRQQESARRMLIDDNNYITEEGARYYWVNPFFHMDSGFVHEYMDRFKIPRNPVKETMCMSGECLCGAFAHKGELQEIELYYPETAAEIRAIEAEVRAAGFPWGWEEQPPQWWIDRKKAEKFGQTDAFADEAEDEIRMLCTSCEYQYAKAQESK